MGSGCAFEAWKLYIVCVSIPLLQNRSLNGKHALRRRLCFPSDLLSHAATYVLVRPNESQVISSQWVFHPAGAAVYRGYALARHHALHVQPEMPDCLFPPNELLIDSPQGESMLTTLFPQGCVWTLAVTGRDPLPGSQGDGIRRRLRMFSCLTARPGSVTLQCNHHNFQAMLKVFVQSILLRKGDQLPQCHISIRVHDASSTNAFLCCLIKNRQMGKDQKSHPSVSVCVFSSRLYVSVFMFTPHYQTAVKDREK